VRADKWVARAALAGPITLEVVPGPTERNVPVGRRIQLELGKAASRQASTDGPYTGGAYVQLKVEEVDALIADLQEAREAASHNPYPQQCDACSTRSGLCQTCEEGF